ncbi:hypothetical protein N7534_002408 [Penicillium rubens]|jgi:hypothetical protein|nr:hypothetical protein N7534_002408 [Penicillium rubens]
MFMMIHVDDFIIAAPHDEDIQQVVDELRQFYDMKDLGEPKQYLNCALDRDCAKKTITMSQKAYVQDVENYTHLSSISCLATPAQCVVSLASKLQEREDNCCTVRLSWSSHGMKTTRKDCLN